jgi:methyl-accepting chemotaxis protein
MQALVGSAAEIADAAGKVSESAEHSVGASKIIGDRILNLTIQSQKIRKIAESIKSIADKSDILALNAALEGAKAGESGRGFVLLGNEMRRLAESIGTASGQVGDLAQEISEFSRGAVLSTEEGQKIAAETAAVARRITLITGQQRTATEQVTKSMDEVHQYTQQALAGAQQARATAGDLARTAAELEDLVISKPLPPAVERA